MSILSVLVCFHVSLLASVDFLCVVHLDLCPCLCRSFSLLALVLHLHHQNSERMHFHLHLFLLCRFILENLNRGEYLLHRLHNVVEGIAESVMMAYLMVDVDLVMLITMLFLDR